MENKEARQMIEAILVFLDMLTNRNGSHSIDLVQRFFGCLVDMGLTGVTGALDQDNMNHMMNLLTNRGAMRMLGKLYSRRDWENTPDIAVIEAQLNQLLTLNNMGLGDHVIGQVLEQIISPYDMWYC